MVPVQTAIGAMTTTTAPGAADLAVPGVSFKPKRVVSGGSLVVKYSLRNVGLARAPSTELRVFASHDRRRDMTDIRLRGTGTVGKIRTGHRFRGRVRATVPTALLPGRYYVIACADASRKLRERNERNNCRAAAQRVRVAPSPNRRSAVIGSRGGLLSLPGVAAIAFAPGAFERKTQVDLLRGRDEKLAPLLDDASSLFDASQGPAYEVRATVGPAQPHGDALLVLTVPATFRMAAPAGSEIRVLILNVWESADERLDSFELADERFPIDAETVAVRVPSFFFTDADQRNGEFRLTATLTTTPTARPSQASSTRAAVNRQEAAKCGGAPIGHPLDPMPKPSSPYGVRTHPTTHVVSMHWGVDLPVPVGTPVLAVADGTVADIKEDGGTDGYRIVIQHANNTGSTSYSHLTPGSARYQLGLPVHRGDVIALSGKSGRATGPHLHLQYAPNGKLWAGGSIDPLPCIDQVVPASIIVRDNGDLLDDAFDVKVNGVLVCQTEIGQSEQCAIGGALRPGAADLTITTRVAPDDVGTFEIVLNDGVTFADGSTSQSGETPEGESMSYKIVIPERAP